MTTLSETRKQVLEDQARSLLLSLDAHYATESDVQKVARVLAETVINSLGYAYRSDKLTLDAEISIMRAEFPCKP